MKRWKSSNVLGKDFYPDLEKSGVQIYDGDYRHWDTWNEGKFNHVLYKETETCGNWHHGQENFDSPQSLLAEMKIIWSPEVILCK
jgi:hypothetical protein